MTSTAGSSKAACRGSARMLREKKGRHSKLLAETGRQLRHLDVTCVTCKEQELLRYLIAIS